MAKKRRHKKGRPSSGSARDLLAKAVKNITAAKKRIHIRAK